MLLPLLAAAFWPVWRWYVARMSDGSDEPLGLLALAAAAAFISRTGWSVPLRGKFLVGAAAAAGGYVMAYGFVPPLIRAMLAVTALACVLPRESGRPMLPLHALLVLSLPLIATLNYFLGYPVRAATAWGTAVILSLGGLQVEAAGAILRWPGGEVLLDAPCSGIRMLWAAATLSATLACVHRLRPLAFLRLAQLTGAAVFAANVARSVILFLLETGKLPNPPWAHEATGLAVFASAMLMCTIAGRRLAVSQCLAPVETPDRIPRRDESGLKTLRTGAVCVLAAAIVAGMRPALADDSRTPVSPASSNIDWPQLFEGVPLERVALHPVEARFAEEFPGAFAAFTDGRRRIVFRRITQPTRKVHPAAGCFRASGFAVLPLPAQRCDESGLWSAMRATKDDLQLHVSEQIRGADGRVWTDVSAWYWSALFKPSGGPWTAVTVIEAEAAPE